MTTLIQGLLTENRYWTFWSDSWAIKVNVFWGGKTKWADVKKAVADKHFPNGIGFGYERQVMPQGLHTKNIFNGQIEKTPYMEFE